VGKEVSQGAKMEGVEAESGAPAMDPLMQYYRSHNQHLFSVQLEFICSLANPSYITFISQEGYLQDKRFLRYLEHLYSTWREPKMARFVRYPYGLYFLECLQRPEFRQAVAQEGWEARAKSQIIAHWATW
jgi:mediator of RNA polymerase II transcription subunit 31